MFSRKNRLKIFTSTETFLYRVAMNYCDSMGEVVLVTINNDMDAVITKARMQRVHRVIFLYSIHIQ